MFDTVRADLRTAIENDPAATSALAVLLTYPGVHAVWTHRLAHACWTRGFALTARVIAHVARFLTGVEVHPAADLGQGVFVDHGMGTVIGETAEVGDGVVMYHGVTLGGKSGRREKRHPTIEDDVEIGADATIIGDVTVGECATVGAGAVVVDDVPPGATVVGVPAESLDRTADGDDGRAGGDEDRADGADECAEDESGRANEEGECGDEADERADEESGRANEEGDAADGATGESDPESDRGDLDVEGARPR